MSIYKDDYVPYSPDMLYRLWYDQDKKCHALREIIRGKISILKLKLLIQRQHIEITWLRWQLQKQIQHK